MLGLGSGFDLPSWLLPSDARTVVQWPIDDANNTFLESQEDYFSTPVAKYTTLKNTNVSTSQMKPVLTELDFLGQNAVFTVAKKGVKVDAESFTGDANNRLTVLPIGIHLKEDTDATLSIPKFIKTC